MFQLYSHSHLYEDAAGGIHSRECTKKSKRKKMAGKEFASPVLQPGTLPLEESGVLETPPRRPESPSSFPRPLPSASDPSSDPQHEGFHKTTSEWYVRVPEGVQLVGYRWDSLWTVWTRT